MAKNEVRNGQAEYGIRHIVEEEMRAAGQGVYGAKNAGGAPSNKATAPSDDMADLPALSSMTKAELEKQAKAEGVDLSDASNNDERRAAIQQARK